MFGGPLTSAPTPANNPAATSKADIPAQLSSAPVIATTPIINGDAMTGAEKFTLQNDVLVLKINALVAF